MINFRFHLISLIAVFLALAVGVVMGYGVLGQPTVDTLQSRVDTVEARADEIRGQNDELRAENSRLRDLVDDLDQFAATSRLSDTDVLPVAVRGVDSGKMEETVQLARLAGASIPGVVWLEDAWSLADEDDADTLATLVDSTATARAEIRSDATRALANRLIIGPTSGRADLLVELDEAGFIALEGVDGVDFEAADVDGASNRMLVVGGNDADVRFDRAVLPLAADLAESGRLVVVADDWRATDRGPSRGDELGEIRGGDLSDRIATVDNFDAVDGPLLTVLVLGDVGQGIVGHYGFGSGADRAAPEWWGV